MPARNPESRLIMHPQRGGLSIIVRLGSVTGASEYKPEFKPRQDLTPTAPVGEVAPRSCTQYQPALPRIPGASMHLAPAISPLMNCTGADAGGTECISTEPPPRISSRAGNRPRLRVAAFTGGLLAGPPRFRIRQYVEPLAQFGVTIDERMSRLGMYPPHQRALRPAWLLGTLTERLPQIAGSWSADVVLLQREMVSTLPTLEGCTRRPRIVDIDDAIHLHRGGRAARHLAKLADLVIVGNSWLAEIWRAWNRNVEILPTPVDTVCYSPEPSPERPTIGWIGSARNLRYLDNIAPALACVLQRFPGTELAVCCDRAPQLPGIALRYVPWRPAVESAFLASLSIGIMPLDDGPWERGKCSFKMLQYMAAGRPCVVSPVGMNREILNQTELGYAASTIDEWIEALSSLIMNRDTAQRLGDAGRTLAVARYSISALAPRFAELLRSVV